MKRFLATSLVVLAAFGLAAFVSPPTNVIAQEYYRDFDDDDLDDDLDDGLYDDLDDGLYDDLDDDLDDDFDDDFDDDLMDDDLYESRRWNGRGRYWSNEADWWENHPYYNEDAWDNSTDWFDGNNYEFEREPSQASVGENKANVAVAEVVEGSVYEF
jgi:hypothetical protein